MPAAKTASSYIASASNGAGSTTTGSTVDLSSKYDAVFQARVTNGATGPTAVCRFVVEISVDGSTWRVFSEQWASGAANAVSDFAVQLPFAIKTARGLFTGNTGQAVTVESTLYTADSI